MESNLSPLNSRLKGVVYFPTEPRPTAVFFELSFVLFFRSFFSSILERIKNYLVRKLMESLYGSLYGIRVILMRLYWGYKWEMSLVCRNYRYLLHIFPSRKVLIS